MAEVGGSAVRLIDKDGDPLDDGNGKLNINATLEAASVNIGDVDILSVPAPLNVTGGGTESAALRVTIANDSTGVVSVDDGGSSLTIDGTVTANLSATDNAVLDDMASKLSNLTTIDADTGGIAVSASSISANMSTIAGTAFLEDSAHSSGGPGLFVLGVHNEDNTVFTAAGDYSGIGVDRYGYISISARAGAFGLLSKPEDSAHVSGDYGIMSLAVRNDDIAGLGGSDGDYSPLQVSMLGGLYVEQIPNGHLDTFAMIDVDNAAEILSDAIGTITDCREIMLQADEDNSGYVIVGDSDVGDNRGMKLNSGDTIILDQSDTRQVYLWGSALNQNVRCMLTRRLV